MCVIRRETKVTALTTSFSKTLFALKPHAGVRSRWISPLDLAAVFAESPTISLTCIRVGSIHVAPRGRLSQLLSLWCEAWQLLLTPPAKVSIVSRLLVISFLDFLIYSFIYLQSVSFSGICCLYFGHFPVTLLNAFFFPFSFFSLGHISKAPSNLKPTPSTTEGPHLLLLSVTMAGIILESIIIIIALTAKDSEQSQSLGSLLLSPSWSKLPFW